MSDNKKRRLPKIKEKREKRGDGSDMNPNKKVPAGHVHDLLTSHLSKPVYGCTLPEIGNGQLMKQHTGNIMKTGSGELVSTHLPALPVKAVSQQQVKKLSKCSSASGFTMDSQRPQQGRLGFEKLPVLPAAVKQDCSNKEVSQLKRDRQMPVHLPPIEKMTQLSSSSSWSEGHKPETAVLRPTTGLENLCKLPEIKSAQVKRSRPKSGNRQPCVLPPIFERREDNKNFKLPPAANAQRPESPKADKPKKKRMM